MPFDLSKTNDIERIQDFHKKYTNRKVREYFNNTPDNSSTPEGIFKRLVTHDENDTALLTLLRLNLWDELRKSDNPEELFYGIPATDFHDRVVFRPQLHLFFRQSPKHQKANNLKYPVRLNMHIRLTNEFLEKNRTLLTEKVENNNLLKKLARNIYRIFNQKNYYKGIEYYTYKDSQKDYQLQLQMKHETTAKELIKDVLEIQGDRPDYQAYFRNHKDDGKFNPVTGEVRDSETVILFGKRVKRNPLKRLTGQVRLHYAELLVHGLVEPVQLVETETKTGKRTRKAIEVFECPA